jgi:hypothetical protein
MKGKPLSQPYPPKSLYLYLLSLSLSLSYTVSHMNQPRRGCATNAQIFPSSMTVSISNGAMAANTRRYCTPNPRDREGKKRKEKKSESNTETSYLFVPGLMGGRWEKLFLLCFPFFSFFLSSSSSSSSSSRNCLTSTENAPGLSLPASARHFGACGCVAEWLRCVVLAQPHCTGCVRMRDGWGTDERRMSCVMLGV